MGDNIFFSFEVVLNFLMKICLFLCFKYTSTLTMMKNVVYAYSVSIKKNKEKRRKKERKVVSHIKGLCYI